MEKNNVASITFFRHECLDQMELLRFTERMLCIIKQLKLKNFKECVIKKGTTAPLELWLHDFQNKDAPMQPFRTYYIVEREDKSLRVVLMLDDVQAQEAPEPIIEPPRVEMYG